jgi:hypothetical protein
LKSTDVLEQHVASNFCHLLQPDSLLGFFFDHEDGGDIFLRHIG